MSCPILLEDDTAYLTEDSVEILPEACPGDPPPSGGSSSIAEWAFVWFLLFVATAAWLAVFRKRPAAAVA